MTRVMIRRLLAATALTSLTVAGTVVVAASPAAAATTVTPTTFANTVTAQAVTITGATGLTSPVAEMVGPGGLKDTYTGTGTKATGCLLGPLFCSGVTTTFNLDPKGLPAAPGTYAVNVCSLSASGCSLPAGSASGSIVVTGAAPTPTQLTTPLVVKPGASGAAGAVTMAGTGFAKDEAMSFSKGGVAATGITFAEDETNSTATALKGTLTVAATAPLGTYDVKVTDTAGKTGICTGCLVVSNASGGTGVTALTAAAAVYNQAKATWSPPTGSDGTGLTYTVVVSTNPNATVSDAGVTATVTGTTATITGLTENKTYTVSVTATSGGVAGLPATTTFTTPFEDTLTLNASPSSIAQGKSVTLSGNLSRTTSGVAVADGTIDIYAKAGNAKYAKVDETTTGSDGSYSTTEIPTTTTSYIAIYLGQAGTGTTAGDSYTYSSSSPRVSVGAFVSVKVHEKQTVHGREVYLTGHVTPNEAGKKVTLVYLGAGGVEQKLATATLSASSHYRFTAHTLIKKLRFKGTYHLRVTTAAHGATGAGESVKFRITKS